MLCIGDQKKREKEEDRIPLGSLQEKSRGGYRSELYRKPKKKRNPVV